MAELNKKIGFIGAGNMGEAMVGALIQSKTMSASMIYVNDVVDERLDLFKKMYGVHTGSDNLFLFSECDIIVLAVKPQSMDKVISGITDNGDYNVSGRKLVISIAAGVPIKKLEALLYKNLDSEGIKNLSIVRVMPNMPCLVLEGMSGMSVNKNVTDEEVKITRTILESMGKVLGFEEKDLNAVTAMSGSGPAYIFYLVESMMAAGVGLGLGEDEASELTLTTIKGAVKLLEEMKASPVELRRKVTSPGGTTEAAFNVMEKNNVKESIVEAITAAARRSEELSG